METVDLSPAFDPGHETYSVSVPIYNSQVTFMPETNDAGATVAYFDGDDTALEDAETGTEAIVQGHQVDTAVGPNTVKVKVTAPDGMTEKTYTVIVTRDRPTLNRGHGAGERDARRALSGEAPSRPAQGRCRPRRSRPSRSPPTASNAR